MALSDWIWHHATYAPRKTAVRYAGADIEYAALAERIDQLAAALHHELKLVRGDRVGIVAANRPEFLDLFFACQRLGAILVPLNWRLAPPEHLYILENADVAAVFCEPEFRPGLEPFRARLHNVRWVGFSYGKQGWLDYAGLVQAGHGRQSPNLGRPEDAALIVYTAGTTGHPKGVILTQDALTWNAVNSLAFHDMTTADRVLTFLPMFHVGGLNIQTLPALHIGATVILHPRFSPDAALRAVAEEKPTLTLLVPAVMRALVEHPGWASADLSSLRLAGAGSSVVPVELIRAFHARGVPICQIYGATETGPIAIVLRREDATRKEGSTGTAALHCEARVIDDSGHDLGPGARGEILIRGRNLMTGYWRDPGATASAFSGEWFHTGDIGHQDDEGYFWIDDRKKDMIVSGGENIYPAELESVLGECADIAEAAVVARADQRWGEVPVAVVVRKPGSPLSAAQVKKLFDGRLARFKHPHDVIFVDMLPRNAMGKILRFRLRETMRAGGLRSL